MLIRVVFKVNLIYMCKRRMLVFCRKFIEVFYRFNEKGEKIRVLERIGRIVVKSFWERRDWKSRVVVKG